MAEEKVIKIELTLTEVNRLFMALNSKKIGTYLPLYNKLQAQTQAQLTGLVQTTNEDN